MTWTGVGPAADGETRSEMAGERATGRAFGSAEAMVAGRAGSPREAIGRSVRMAVAPSRACTAPVAA